MQSSDEPASLTAAEAAELLGVKPQTLYAYASRGLVRRVGDGKRRRYLREDLERLRTRQRARSGHGPVAAAALAFGEPVLDTALSTIDERGPLYRGRPAVELAQAGTSFESVAELLWTGTLPGAPPRWELGPGGAGGSPIASLEDLLLACAGIVHAAPERHSRAPEVELALARRTIARLATQVAGSSEGASTVAQRLASLASAPRRDATAALDAALVLIADHELNASSFAARIAASTDASLPACLLAALATLTGPRHGGACDRVEALLEEASRLKRASQVIEMRLRRGDAIPGFGHPLYPKGDPRASALLKAASTLARRPKARAQLRPLVALARSMAGLGLPPTVDYGLVALCRALGAKPGVAALVFALGRAAGWVAHVLEQRRSPAVLRPRARYTPS